VVVICSSDRTAAGSGQHETTVVCNQCTHALLDLEPHESLRLAVNEQRESEALATTVDTSEEMKDSR
jgi:hypothetical protein